MFGYVRPYKPQMKICEFEVYKAVYCGLCKELGRSFGQTARFTLSYDFAFLALMRLAVNTGQITIHRERCIAHPLKKGVCAGCKSANGEFRYAAYAAMILVYHKLRDDTADRGLKKRLAARILLLKLKKAYQKAAAAYPALARCVEEQMQAQSVLERELCESPDAACEPTARMMAAIAAGMAEDEKTARVLEQFGYHLGRYVYLCDAFDDLAQDYAEGGYNPLLVKFAGGIAKHGKKAAFPPEIRQQAAEYTERGIHLSLAELANAYVLADFKGYCGITDNIVYLGLHNTWRLVKAGQFSARSKKEFKAITE